MPDGAGGAAVAVGAGARDGAGVAGAAADAGGLDGGGVAGAAEVVATGIPK